MKHLIDSLPSLLYSKPRPIEDDVELISFHFVTDPPPTAFISFPDYVTKLLTESEAGLEPLVYAVCWLVRLGKQRPGLDISQWTIHRLFLSAFVVAIKYCNDFYWNNEEYASIGGITLKDLNKLELLFAHNLMGWNLYIDQEHDQEFKAMYMTGAIS